MRKVIVKRSRRQNEQGERVAMHLVGGAHLTETAQRLVGGFRRPRWSMYDQQVEAA